MSGRKLRQAARVFTDSAFDWVEFGDRVALKRRKHDRMGFPTWA